MKLKDFNRTRKVLENEIKKNNEPSHLYDERTRMARVNQFNYKLTTTIAFSLMGYLGLVIVSALSLALFDTPLFIKSIPPAVYPVYLLGSSAIIGTVTRTSLERKFKLKERLAAFTNASSEKEKFIEEIKNEIELKKIENRNLALTRTIEKLTADENTLLSISDKYEVNDKDRNLSKEEREHRVIELESALAVKYNALDSLTTAKLLHSRFSHQLDKSVSIVETIAASCGGGMFVLLYLFITVMLAYTNTPFQLPPNFSSVFTVLSPFIIGTSVSGGYLVYRNKVKKEAFATIKETLTEKELSSEIEKAFNDNQDFEKAINDTISEITKLTIEIQENKRALEEFSMTSPDEEPSLTLSDTKSIREEKHTDLTDEEILGISAEEPYYEEIVPRTELQNEIKTLSKKRRGPYQK